jgi:hypothetical protein
MTIHLVRRVLLSTSLLAPLAGTGAAADTHGIPAAQVVAVEPGDDDEILSKGADVDGVEIKVTLDPSRVAALLAALGAEDALGAKRDVWFYDTRGLRLFETGVILRARVKGDKADATAKVRPFERTRVDASWWELRGFKCEEDRIGERRVPSCSITGDRSGAQVLSVASGEQPIAGLFSSDQARFVSDAGAGSLSWTDVAALGPIHTIVWKVRTRLFEEPLVAEAWRLNDGEDVLELSLKTVAADADQRTRALEAYLQGLGFEAQPLQEAKTRRALERFASAHAR